MKLGLQLYTLRGEFKKAEDMVPILEKVKAIGFEGVELGGDCFAEREAVQKSFGKDAAAFKEILDAVGLEVCGTHVPFEKLTGPKLEDHVAFLKSLDCAYIGTGGASTGSDADLRHTVAEMRRVAECAATQGLSAYYHNHSHEFKKKDGKYKLDFIKEVCQLQVDVYWSFFAKVDTPAYIRANAEHIRLLHAKDGSRWLPKPTALGEGKNNLPAIFAAAKDIGCEWMILENDFPRPDGIADITRSMAYMKTLV